LNVALSILLASTRKDRLDGLAVALSGAGIQVEAVLQPRQSAVFSGQAPPHAVLLDVPLDSEEGQEWMVLAATHKATCNLPLVVVTPPVRTQAALGSFQAGVGAVVDADRPPAEVVATLQGILGPAPDPERLATLTSRGGAHTLRRVFGYLVERHATGRLIIRGPDEPTAILLEQGQPQNAAYGMLRGPAALDRLMGQGSASVWDFFFMEGRPTIAPGSPLAGPVGPDGALADFPLLEAPSPEQLASVPPARVLFVDDDAHVLDLFRTHFTGVSWATLRTAVHGEEGLATAREWRPDIIVSDLVMPRMNGWDLLSAVRSDFRLKETRFLLYSEDEGFLEQLRGLEAGAEAYLSKSMPAAQVLDEVFAVLAPRRNFVASLRPGVRLSVPVRGMGILALVRSFIQARLSGVAHADDGFFTYRVGFNRGLLGAVEASMGEFRSTGREALRALLGAEDGTVALDPQQRAEPHGWGRPSLGLVDDLCEETNAVLEAARDLVLQRPARLAFDPGGLAFYRSVIPVSAVPVVDALSMGASPHQLLAQPAFSRALVEWVVKDLLRKGLVAVRDA
jgi:CheY-like chemotaxis protein